MAKTLKYIFFIALLGVIVFAAWKFRNFFSFPKQQVVQNSEVIMERLEKVNKLVTVDAYYSELKDYKDYYYYDFSFFRKKAIIQISAKVSVGYNFDKINIEADETTKTINIFDFPQPEILSIDHDLNYYDITEGTFNSFTIEDYNKMNTEAKELISNVAKNDKSLFVEAEAQKDELLDMFNLMARAGGWKIQVAESENVKILD
jgi:hypothetical protein